MKKTRHAKLFALSISLLMFAMYPGFGHTEQISNSVIEVTHLPSNPVVNRGDSKEHVDKLLGASKGWKADNEETAYYERGYVLFRDGKAVKFSILSDAELLERKRRYEIEYVPIPRTLSAQEVEDRERICRQQQEERKNQQEREMANYKRSQSQQHQGQQLVDDAKGIAIYQQQGLDRKQYEEDAAFVRNLMAGSSVPVIRFPASPALPSLSTLPSLISKSDNGSYDSINNTTPLSGNQKYRSQGSVDVGTSVGGAILPGSHGGMVIGGPMGGTILPGSQGGMVIGGPMDGTILPGSKGGMVIGGPMGGSILPDSQGGMVIGGSMGGSILPGNKGGMVIGGPLNGSLMPGSKGGMVIGGPLNGSLMPGQ